MQNSAHSKQLFLIMTWVVLNTLPLAADVGGTVLGTVTDPSGAAVVAARVHLANPNNGVDRLVETDKTGSYEFLAVPAAEGYVVTVEASGFAASSQSGFTLLVNQKYRADFKLRIGATAQKVEVSANAVQVESTSTQIGEVINSAKMTAVPLNGRSYVDLLAIQAGVAPTTTDSADDQVGGNFSVNGQRENANAFMVNGSTVERSYDNGASVVPVLDSIQEFRLITSTFDAEYGRFSGAVVNVVTKPGTNTFHGSLFEFLRNDKLDAPGYFNVPTVDAVTGAVIPALPKLEQSQFGGTIGGPIKKNKLFFFGDYQGTRTIQGASSGDVNVPTAAMRSGDFSNLPPGYLGITGVVHVSASGPGTMDTVLSQRLGYAVTPGEPYWTAGCNTLANAQAGMCVFPGQVIPQSAWSAPAIATLKFIPGPTVFSGGQPFFFTNNQHKTSGDDTYESRVDLNTQGSGNWMFYFHRDAGHTRDPFDGGNVPGFAGLRSNNNINTTISNTRSFGPLAVNEARIGFTRSFVRLSVPEGPFAKISSYGFVRGGLGIVPGDPSHEGLPQINLNQLGITFGLPDNFSLEPNNIYHASDSLWKVWGEHTAKFGADFRYIQFNIRQKIEENGVFSFNGTETGNDFADFLIGAPSGYGQASTGFNQDARTHYFGAFAQDTWKIKSNVTLSYGLRWDLSQPFYDTLDRLQAFLPGKQSTKFVNSPEDWVFSGDPGVPRTIAKTDYRAFAPRLGIAYSPGFTEGPLSKLFGGPGKTSIRAASGLYYTTVQEAPVFFELGDAPFGLFYGSPALVYFDLPFQSRVDSNNPGQRFPVPLPQKNVSFAPFMPISGSTIVYPRNVLPRTTHFNASIQRQLSSSTILTVAYIGSVGRHLVTQIEANPGIASRCLAIAALFAQAGNPGGGCGPSAEDGIWTVNNQTFYGARPYSVTSGRLLSQGLLDFGGTLPYNINSANSDFHSLQTTLEKRAGSWTFLAAYTYSKSMDNSSGFHDGTNPYNPALSRSISAFDVTHNFVASYVYQLPFDRLGHSGLKSKVLGGWAISGITRLRTGFPVTLTESGDLALCGCFGGNTNGVDEPNYKGQRIRFLDPKSSPNNLSFDTSPFSGEQIGVPGNSRRRFFHGPDYIQTDAALLKDTHFTERLSLQFRAEFFNVFNHTSFKSPSGDINSPTFGQVHSAADGRIGQMALKLNF